MRESYFRMMREVLHEIKRLENLYSFVSTKNEIERPNDPVFPAKENENEIERPNDPVFPAKENEDETFKNLQRR